MSQQYLVVDNGSYSIKAGFSTGDYNENNALNALKTQNSISRTKDGLIYIGNDYLTQTNNYSGINIKRPHEQGHLTSWETEKPIWDYTLDKLSPKKELDLSSIHLTLTETPFQLPQLSINTDQIIFEEYGFNEYYRCAPASLAPWLNRTEAEPNDFNLIIDSGFQSTWIIPVIYQKVWWKGVKKLPIGGKLLNGLLRDLISFRHYDITDEPLLINTIKEQTCFVANDFNKILQNKLDSKCEFVLPDFKTTITGYVRTKDTELSQDVQSLKLFDERFSVPESIFHPEVIFDNNSTSANNSMIQSTPFKNIIDLIVESIMSCPEITRPLLSGNITFVGGTTNLSNFKERILYELKKELPGDWIVKSKPNLFKNYDEVNWHGGLNLVNNDIIDKLSISRKEYFEHGSNWCQNHFGFENIIN